MNPAMKLNFLPPYIMMSDNANLSDTVKAYKAGRLDRYFLE
jgi:hypothetical protein